MDKPFRPIDEQIAILSSRGVITNDSTKTILKREGYYSVVNGYKDLFIDKAATASAHDDRYMTGTSFDDIYRLFLFDRGLRLTMFRYFSEAEATPKTICAYKFSERHKDEPEAYLNLENYRQDGYYPKRAAYLVDDFKKILHKTPYERHLFKRDYIQHYVRNHDEVPLWVLTNFLMLSQIFKFYDFQPESMRNAIAACFSGLYTESYSEAIKISPKRLRLTYDHIKDFRNICAHDERLYCARVSPSKSIRFADMLTDLKLVLSRDEFSKAQNDVLNLVAELMKDLGQVRTSSVLELMGIQSISSTLMPS